MGQRILAAEKADVVARGSLQPAMLNVEHLVEHTGHMEAQTALLVKLAVFVSPQIIIGEPSHRGEGVFQLVAVIVLLLRPDDGHQLRKLKFSEVLEVVLHLFLLVSQLFAIVEHLPFAAAAHAEMAAWGHHAVGRGLAHRQQVRLRVPVLALIDFHIHHIAGHGKGDKNGETVQLGHGLALRTRGDDFQVFYVISFECHF